MFENLSLYSLQQYWWIVISILAAVLVFLFFVQGGQTLLFQIAKNENEKTLLINALGRKWELTFTTIVTFGGAMFAAFPLFYSTSFGSAYWLWIIILIGFILQAVSYEFRKKKNNILSSKFYEYFLFINGISAVFIIGIVVATFFSGSHFIIDKFNLSMSKYSSNGLESLFSLFNVIFALSVLFLTRVLGAMFFLKYVDCVEISSRATKQIIFNGVLFLIFFLTFLIMLLLKNGYSYNNVTSEFVIEKNKYLNNFLQMPFITILFLTGAIATILGIFYGGIKKSSKSFFITALGVVLVVFTIFIISAFNNTSFYPSLADIKSSLTITNASSTKYTLVVMSYVTLLLPFVIAYVIYIWRILSKNKINQKEIENTEHIY